MNALDIIREKRVRRVVGLMSGTSADGVDAALVEIVEDSGFAGARLLNALTIEYPTEVKERLRSISSAAIESISALDFQVGEVFAEAASRVILEAGRRSGDCDLIGSHGQTVCHLPGGDSGSTLQIGQASVIVERTGIVTVSDFRTADVAAGGEGAPLVPLADFYLFRHDLGTRLLLNIGGIANLSIITPDREGVCGFDTGPGNAMIDAAVERSSGGAMAYDDGGKIAAGGTHNDEMLDELLRHPYFSSAERRSTGTETFGKAYVDDLLSRHSDLSMADFVATLTLFTARSIGTAIKSATPPAGVERNIYVGGGGSHNLHLMDLLGREVTPMELKETGELGIPADYREAVAFALLANETVEGRPGNIPAATGARREVVLGKISLA